MCTQRSLYLVFYTCVIIITAYIQPVMLLILPVKLLRSISYLACHVTQSVLYSFCQPVLKACTCLVTQPTLSIACHTSYLAYLQLVKLFNLSTYNMSRYLACLWLVIACNAAQIVSCYLACLQPILLLSQSIACHVSQHVYSLSSYLACLQAVMLLSLPIAYQATYVCLQPVLLLSQSIVCHVTQPVYSLSCCLSCLQPIMLHSPVMLTYSINIPIYSTCPSSQLYLRKQFPKPLLCMCHNYNSQQPVTLLSLSVACHIVYQFFYSQSCSLACL